MCCVYLGIVVQSLRLVVSWFTSVLIGLEPGTLSRVSLRPCILVL